MVLLQHGGSAGEVPHYIPPLLVDELPPGKTASEFVAELDRSAVHTHVGVMTDGGGGRGGSAHGGSGRGSGGGGAIAGMAVALHPLVVVEACILDDASTTQLLVVTGDGGTGKSTLLKRLGARLARNCRTYLQRPAAERQPAPWTPLLLELRHFTVSTLYGIIPKYLESRLGVPHEVVNAFQTGTLPVCSSGMPLVRLLVLCDGSDEMMTGGSGTDEMSEVDDGTGVLQNFVATLCGGRAWPRDLLRVIVTTRGDGRAPGCTRRVLLPFGEAQVWHRPLCFTSFLYNRT